MYAFDCLYLNGKSLLHKPLSERREALYSALVPKEGQLAFATAKTSRDVEELAVRGERGRGWGMNRGEMIGDGTCSWGEGS